MRFLHTADWHIGKIVNEFSMLEQQRMMLQQLISILKTKQYDCLVIAGDLYDRSQPSAESMSLVNQTFKEIVMELNIPILLIAGNHDSAQLIEYGNYLMVSQQFYGEGLVKKEIKKVSIKDTDFYLFPFVTPAQLQLMYQDKEIKTYQDVFNCVLKTLKLDETRQNVLIAHGYFIDQQKIFEKEDSVRPLSIGTAEYVEVSCVSNFDYVALGHLHSAHHIGSNKVQYCGSLYKYSKSEAHNKLKFIDVTLDNHQVTTTPLFLKCDKDLIIKRGRFDELIKEKSDDYVFFELEDELVVLDAISRLKQRYPNAMGLEYCHHQQTIIQTKLTQHEIKQKSLPQLFADFYSESTQQSLNDQQLEIVNDVMQEVLDETH